MAGLIKILPLFIMVMPGMMARVLYPGKYIFFLQILKEHQHTSKSLMDLGANGTLFHAVQGDAVKYTFWLWRMTLKILIADWYSYLMSVI